VNSEEKDQSHKRLHKQLQEQPVLVNDRQKCSKGVSGDSRFRRTAFSRQPSEPNAYSNSNRRAVPDSTPTSRALSWKDRVAHIVQQKAEDILVHTDDPRAKVIQHNVLVRLAGVRDPELGRSLVEMGMITSIEAKRRSDDSVLDRPPQARPGQDVYDVHVKLELTISGCPLTNRLLDDMTDAVASYPDDVLVPRISVGVMSKAKLGGLVEELRRTRHSNPFNNPDSPESRTRIIAVASGKGGVGKSAIAADLAATFAALGYSTAAIDADIYGFSLPGIFGVHSRPTDLDGMLMPVSAWGVRLMSIGMFAGSDQPILWRGPRLQRSLQQFLTDVWWNNPDVMVLDLPPGTGDMAISVAQLLPAAQTLVVTTPQQSASRIAIRAGLASLRLPGTVAGVVENMSWYEYHGQQLPLFGEGGGQRAAQALSASLGYSVPLLARIPLDPQIRETEESGRPSVLDSNGHLLHSARARAFVKMAQALIGAHLREPIARS
jgi:ATP-binding protein involved in chromosome partitioning